MQQTATCARQNKIRDQSRIKCTQVASVDEKMADPQINNSAVQDFFVRGIEGKIGFIEKRFDKYFESAIKRKVMKYEPSGSAIKEKST